MRGGCCRRLDEKSGLRRLRPIRGDCGLRSLSQQGDDEGRGDRSGMTEGGWGSTILKDGAAVAGGSVQRVRAGADVPLATPGMVVMVLVPPPAIAASAISGTASKAGASTDSPARSSPPPLDCGGRVPGPPMRGRGARTSAGPSTPRGGMTISAPAGTTTRCCAITGETTAKAAMRARGTQRMVAIKPISPAPIKWNHPGFPITCRAMITRMISFVPSRMRCTRRSRTIFSMP